MDLYIFALLLDGRPETTSIHFTKKCNFRQLLLTNFIYILLLFSEGNHRAVNIS